MTSMCLRLGGLTFAVSSFIEWVKKSFSGMIAAIQCSNGFVHDVQCSSNDTEYTTMLSTCVEGCFCPPEMVEHNNTCILDEPKRTCKLDGITYQHGQTAAQRCYVW